MHMLLPLAKQRHSRRRRKDGRAVGVKTCEKSRWRRKIGHSMVESSFIVGCKLESGVTHRWLPWSVGEAWWRGQGNRSTVCSCSRCEVEEEEEE